MFLDTPLIMVEDTATLKEVCEKLAEAPGIGVDTESDSFHHYREKVCLIQVSDLVADYIIDPLKVEDMSPLGPILADRTKTKILHGADYDIVCLKRDFGFETHKIFDTMLAAQFLAYPKIGLADLIGRFFGHKIDKKYQRHDWSRRPLEPEHLMYARGDTHWLLALLEVMGRQLERNARMEALQEECELLEQREWSGRTVDDKTAFLRIKRSSSLDDDSKRVLRALWLYRDKQAQALDRPAFKVMSDHYLLDLAKSQPTDTNGLHKILRAGSALAKRHGKQLLEAVAVGLEDDSPIPVPEAKPKTRQNRRRSGAGVEQVMNVLKAWRNEIVERKDLAPVVVANNGLLREIAKANPTTLEELSGVQGIRQWQLKEFGEEILTVLQERKPAGQSGRRRNPKGGSRRGPKGE